MLGKTAGGLFWMSRYLERAENTARLLETGQRMALTRTKNSVEEWASVLQTAGVLNEYLAKYDEVTKDNAVDWVLRDADNASSVKSVIKQARDNARLVRTALTHDVWSAVNATWMQIDAVMKRRVNERDLPAVLELIRHQAALVRGANLGTMLRNDIFDFTRIGTFVERADNTGRILDVKYYVLLPTAFSVGSSLDNIQWESILRSVGAGGGYRLTYGQKTSPTDIAQFLILDGRMPRSLHFCCRKIQENLAYLMKDYGFAGPSIEASNALYEKYLNRQISEIFESGLHEYIQDFLNDLVGLSRQIEIDYRFYE
ncbi:A alpha-helical domain with a conserved ER moti [Ruegeria sp. ANG-S4]|uniref:alpha-E domain-containing protein n=1 Tax=Ruegeria sp. ANG-S4 TaxID=1577904 RepID=UPI0005808300|nr:alpha-E domain-containing protein [Ruegeria sp. ANG-S4]KIC45787.1 A alpha-helical domain with a conserved ER moti [Ruegeria sp. ANG-S4]